MIPPIKHINPHLILEASGVYHFTHPIASLMQGLIIELYPFNKIHSFEIHLSYGSLPDSHGVLVAVGGEV